MSSNNYHQSRRRFLQSAFYSSLLYACSSAPPLIRPAEAAPAPLQNRLLINLYLDGGPDFRHLIAPAYDPAPDSFGNKYWTHRARSHRLAETGVTAQQRWQNDYYPITVGGSGWNGGLVDSGGLNSGVTFGIWREAGWLIDMFRAGHVALVFNAVGGDNRAHDLSTLMLLQGDLFTTLNNRDHSGWGGRLARSANGKLLSLSSSPNAFCFGPSGAAPNYNPEVINNIDLLSVENSREIGLFDFDFNSNQVDTRNHKMARAVKGYYAALRQEQFAGAYQKFLDHESKVRETGELIRNRLDTVAIPNEIQALYSAVIGADGPINPDPGAPAQARPVVHDRYSFAAQIRNLYDVIAANDLLNPRVTSMRYGGWDSHAAQRIVPSILSTDPHNADADRGIENGFKDIFGGKFGVNPSNPNAWHSGFSALWSALPNSVDRQQLALTIAGEFGRQIRDNGDLGTDHGRGNLTLVISERCNGGVYGEIFQEAEVDKYDDNSLNTPDIEPRTEIDSIYSKVCDWVAPSSGSAVFPRTATTFGGVAPLIEVPGMFDNLMT